MVRAELDQEVEQKEREEAARRLRMREIASSHRAAVEERVSSDVSNSRIVTIYVEDLLYEAIEVKGFTTAHQVTNWLNYEDGGGHTDRFIRHFVVLFEARRDGLF